jgi:hypothetical protein
VKFHEDNFSRDNEDLEYSEDFVSKKDDKVLDSDYSLMKMIPL